MSLLSDLSLRTYLESGRLVCEPLADDAVGPSSLDLTLGATVLVPGPGQYADISSGILPPRHDTVDLGLAPWFLRPRECVLGATLELISIPPDLVGILLGRSTLARLFLQVEAAGLIDAGYRGHPTLELVNQGPHTIRLYPGMPIAQLVVLRMTTPALRPYGGLRSRYQDDLVAQPARLPVVEVAG